MATLTIRDLTTARHIHALNDAAVAAGDTDLQTALEPYINDINIYTDYKDSSYDREHAGMNDDNVDLLGAIKAIHVAPVA